MTNETQKRHKPVKWDQPPQRMAMIYTHHVICERCGKEFTVENAMPVAPRYCSRAINSACYTARRTETQRRWRANAKENGGKTAEEK